MLEAILRVVHIIAGVWFVGYFLMMMFIVLPSLNKLGPGMVERFMQAAFPVLEPILLTSFVLIVGTGIAYTLILSGGISPLFSTVWGWAMIIALVLMAAIQTLASIFLEPTMREVGRVGRSIQGRAPTAEEARQLGRLSQKAKAVFGINFVFAVFIFIDMLIARYV